jgi:two-component system sensor histidine kinase YesM
VIPIIIFAVFEFKAFEARNIKDEINKSSYALDLEVLNIEKKKEMMESTARMITGNSQLMYSINQFDKLDEHKLVEFNQNDYRNTMQVQYSNPSINAINIFLRNDNVTEIWPLVISEKRILNKEWYKDTLKNDGRDYWDFNYTNESIYDIKYDETKYYSDSIGLCQVIHYTKNKILGVIRINMLAKDFFSKLYSEVSDADSQMYVVDNKNHIHTNNTSPFSIATGVKKELIADEFIKNSRLKKNNFIINKDKKHLIAVYKKIKGLDCYVINVTSIEPMLRDTQHNRNITILGILFLISILFVATYVTTMKILKKLYLIIQSMKKIQNGDFDIEIPVRGNDEIGELAHHFRKMLKKIDELISEAAHKKTTTKEAELRALKTQIDSHFIYNVLENIKMMAEIEGNYEVSDSLTSLGAMLRYNLKWKGEYVSLHDELEHIKNYISLMNIRYDNKIKLSLSIEPELMKHDILKMSLQPLVENCVKHGLLPVIDDRDGQIEIEAKVEDNNIKISVTDNGIGIKTGRLLILNAALKMDNPMDSADDNGQILEVKKDSNGIGLKNVNERLKLYYGDEAKIEVFSELNMFTRIIMTLTN